MLVLRQIFFFLIDFVHCFFFFTVCGTNCHIKCAKNMPPLCGVNEKLLSEALKNVDEIKKNRRQVEHYNTATLCRITYHDLENVILN